MIQLLIKTIAIIVVAKLISLSLLWFLPNNGVELKTQNNYNPKYQRVDFKNMLTATSNSNNKIQSISTNGIVITNMILKGLYGANSNGFAIIALKAKPNDTTIVSVGEGFKGYQLKNIFKQSVVLMKNSKEYILKMQTKKFKSNTISYLHDTINQNTTTKENQISKQDIKYYTSNPKQVWKDITLSRVENPKGFRVDKIKKDSKMDKLGLKKGDIIIKANNIELKSLKNVMKIYNNIKDITAMEIVVLRNKQEVELSYEIY